MIPLMKLNRSPSTLLNVTRITGIDIQYLRRPNREGFKAGALAFGLTKAKGEFIVVFDADFIPSREMLMQTIHYFTDPEIGMVQARWGHINSEYSMLTNDSIDHAGWALCN